MSDDWITIKEAAWLMKVNEKKLRKRGEDGRWLFYPELARLQPDGKNCRIWFFKSQILAWIERVEAEAKAASALPVIQPGADSQVLSQETIDHFRRKGYLGTLKAFGIEA